MPYHIKKAKNGQFYNVLISRNGKVLSTSETMKKHAAVVKNIKSQMKTLDSSEQKVFDEVKKTKYELWQDIRGKIMMADLPTPYNKTKK